MDDPPAWPAKDEYVTVEAFERLLKQRDDLLAALALEHDSLGRDHGQLGHDGDYPDCDICDLMFRVRSGR